MERRIPKSINVTFLATPATVNDNSNVMQPLLHEDQGGLTMMKVTMELPTPSGAPYAAWSPAVKPNTLPPLRSAPPSTTTQNDGDSTGDEVANNNSTNSGEDATKNQSESENGNAGDAAEGTGELLLMEPLSSVEEALAASGNNNNNINKEGASSTSTAPRLSTSLGTSTSTRPLSKAGGGGSRSNAALHNKHTHPAAAGAPSNDEDDRDLKKRRLPVRFSAFTCNEKDAAIDEMIFAEVPREQLTLHAKPLRSDKATLLLPGYKTQREKEILRQEALAAARAMKGLASGETSLINTARSSVGSAAGMAVGTPSHHHHLNSSSFATTTTTSLFDQKKASRMQHIRSQLGPITDEQGNPIPRNLLESGQIPRELLCGGEPPRKPILHADERVVLSKTQAREEAILHQFLHAEEKAEIDRFLCERWLDKITFVTSWRILKRVLIDARTSRKTIQDVLTPRLRFLLLRWLRRSRSSTTIRALQRREAGLKGERDAHERHVVAQLEYEERLLRQLENAEEVTAAHLDDAPTHNNVAEEDMAADGASATPQPRSHAEMEALLFGTSANDSSKDVPLDDLEADEAKLLRNTDPFKRPHPRVLKSRCPAFRDWPLSALEQLVAAMEPRVYKPLSHLFFEGDPCEGWYFVVQGEVTVCVPQPMGNGKDNSEISRVAHTLPKSVTVRSSGTTGDSSIRGETFYMPAPLPVATPASAKKCVSFTTTTSSSSFALITNDDHAAFGHMGSNNNNNNKSGSSFQRTWNSGCVLTESSRPGYVVVEHCQTHTDYQLEQLNQQPDCPFQDERRGAKASYLPPTELSFPRHIVELLQREAQRTTNSTTPSLDGHVLEGNETENEGAGKTQPPQLLLRKRKSKTARLGIPISFVQEGMVFGVEHVFVREPHYASGCCTNMEQDTLVWFCSKRNTLLAALCGLADITREVLVRRFVSGMHSALLATNPITLHAFPIAEPKLFGCWHTAGLFSLMPLLETELHQPGDRLMEYGVSEPIGQAKMYYVLRGLIGIAEGPGSQLHRVVGPGEIFGIEELVLCSATPHPISAVCLTSVSVAVLTQEKYLTVAREFGYCASECRTNVAALISTRMVAPTSTPPALHKDPVLAFLFPPDLIEAIWKLAQPLYVLQGDALFRSWDAASYLWVVTEGAFHELYSVENDGYCVPMGGTMVAVERTVVASLHPNADGLPDDPFYAQEEDRENQSKAGSSFRMASQLLGARGGAVLGAVELASQSSLYYSSCRATSHCVVWRIPRKAIESFVAEDRPMLWSAMRLPVAVATVKRHFNAGTLLDLKYEALPRSAEIRTA